MKKYDQLVRVSRLLENEVQAYLRVVRDNLPDDYYGEVPSTDSSLENQKIINDFAEWLRPSLEEEGAGFPLAKGPRR